MRTYFNIGLGADVVCILRSDNRKHVECIYGPDFPWSWEWYGQKHSQDDKYFNLVDQIKAEPNTRYVFCDLEDDYMVDDNIENYMVDNSLSRKDYVRYVLDKHGIKAPDIDKLLS